MADSTLNAIRTKVRRLTRTLSTNQLSNTDLDEYINTFVLYDFPEHLRLFSLRKTFTFTTNVGQDTYPISAAEVINVNNPLYDFNNRYITVHEPIYIAGYKAFYTQSRDQFFNVYPKNDTISGNTGVEGDGVTTNFTGQFPFVLPATPGTNGTVITQKSFFITSLSAIGESMTLRDIPVVDPTTGFRSIFGNLYVVGSEPTVPPTLVDGTNFMDYTTGAFNVTFPLAPAAEQPIIAECRPGVTSRPEALLYFDGAFTVRPIPDQGYPIEFEVYVRPTQLMADSDEPQLQQWWQYIAYGAAKKYFEDQQDLESVQLILPEFKQQERLVLRRTIVQQTEERVATIYTEANFGGTWFNRQGGSGI